MILRFLKKRRGGLYSVLDTVLKPYDALTSIVNRYAKLETYVIGSGVSPSIDRYLYILSIALFFSSISIFIASSMLTIYILGMPILIGITVSAIALFIIILSIIAIGIAIPRILYANRSSVLESKAILLLLAISMLSSSGMNIYSVFERIQDVLGNDYRYFSVEIDRIRYLTRAGMPIDDVLRDVSQLTPSQTMRELFSSLSSFSRVGGNIVRVIEDILMRYISRYELGVERVADTLTVYMEIYVAVSLLIPILIGSLAMLFLVYPLRGISFEAIIFLSTFIIIPITSIAITILSDMAVSRLRP